MDKYLLIGGIAIIVSVISFIVEYINPIIKNCGKNTDTIKNVIYRFLHYYVVLYVVLFIFIFKANSVHAYAYLLVTLVYFAIWYICECCVLSYLELKSYDVDHNNYLKTFHPVFTVFTGGDNIPNGLEILAGIIILSSIGCIFYYNKSMPLYIKISYVILASYLLIETMVKDRLNNNYKYPTNDNSFFMKYLHF